MDFLFNVMSFSVEGFLMWINLLYNQLCCVVEVVEDWGVGRRSGRLIVVTELFLNRLRGRLKGPARGGLELSNCCVAINVFCSGSGRCLGIEIVLHNM